MKIEINNEFGAQALAILKADGSSAKKGIDYSLWQGKYHAMGKWGFSPGGIEIFPHKKEQSFILVIGSGIAKHRFIRISILTPEKSQSGGWIAHQTEIWGTNNPDSKEEPIFDPSCGLSQPAFKRGVAEMCKLAQNIWPDASGWISKEWEPLPDPAWERQEEYFKNQRKKGVASRDAAQEIKRLLCGGDTLSPKIERLLAA